MNAWGEKLRHGLILVVAILMMSTPVAGAVSFADGSMSGDISSVPMDTAQTQSQGKNVDARILNFYSDEGDFEPGDQVTAEVEVRNTGDSSHTFFVGYSVIDPSGEYYDNDGQTGRTVTLDSNEREFVSVSWTVQDDSPTGEYDAVTSIWAESDKDNLQTRLDNERRNNVFEVVEPTVVDAQITDFDVESGEFKQSDTVDATATVKNTGNTEHTFFVGYSAVGENDESYDNDDETGQTVTLDPDEEESVSLEWMVEDDVPTGEYSAVTSAWKESDRNNLNTQLDRIQRNDAFEVVEPTVVDAQITDFDVESGEFKQSDTVDATATVENTGNTEHTFFVGYSAVGENDESYDNDDETGQTVTLDPDEEESVSLEWMVEDDVPTGEYSAVTSVWKESDRNNLNTQLDRIQRNDAFKVAEPTEISARITSFSIDRGEFTQGESVAATATVENTGNTEHTFFVGYSVVGTNGESYDNNDETGRAVTLGPGESRTISLSWTVQRNTPTGTYDAVTVVWKESDQDNLNTPLDRIQRGDAIEVTEPTEISARVTSFSVDRGEFTQGKSVAATATVENTGNTKHTFFVGYSVIGTNGKSYDNNDETGRAVTLGPDESRTISLSWTVQRNTPTGTYDAVTVVWKESDQDNLNTPLDRVQRNDAIEVVEPTELNARITNFNIETGDGKFTQGESVAATTTVKNTGNIENTFFVGYSVIGTNGKSYDNNDETGQTVTLGPDESRTISLSWTVQSNTPTGTYDAVTVVWKESDRDNLNTPLDRTQRGDVIKVIDSTEISARIVSSDLETGVFKYGETVNATATIKNTGTAKETLYIGYTASHKESDRSYDVPAKSITVAPGEETDIALTWTVPNGAPNGVYRLDMALWRKSTDDGLIGNLDRVTERVKIDPSRRAPVEIKKVQFVKQSNSISKPGTDEWVIGDRITFQITLTTSATAKSYDGPVNGKIQFIDLPTKSSGLELIWNADNNMREIKSVSFNSNIDLDSPDDTEVVRKEINIETSFERLEDSIKAGDKLKLSKPAVTLTVTDEVRFSAGQEPAISQRLSDIRIRASATQTANIALALTAAYSGYSSGSLKKAVVPGKEDVVVMTAEQVPTFTRAERALSASNYDVFENEIRSLFAIRYGDQTADELAREIKQVAIFVDNNNYAQAVIAVVQTFDTTKTTSVDDVTRKAQIIVDSLVGIIQGPFKAGVNIWDLLGTATHSAEAIDNAEMTDPEFEPGTNDPEELLRYDGFHGVSGTVYRPNGQPIQQATVKIYKRDPKAGDFVDPIAKIETSSDGRFRKQNLDINENAIWFQVFKENQRLTELPRLRKNHKGRLVSGDSSRTGVPLSEYEIYTDTTIQSPDQGKNNIPNITTSVQTRNVNEKTVEAKLTLDVQSGRADTSTSGVSGGIHFRVSGGVITDSVPGSFDKEYTAGKFNKPTIGRTKIVEFSSTSAIQPGEQLSTGWIQIRAQNGISNLSIAHRGWAYDTDTARVIDNQPRTHVSRHPGGPTYNRHAIESTYTFLQYPVSGYTGDEITQISSSSPSPSPGSNMDLTRTVSSQEVAPNEEITVRTEISGVSGDITLNTTHDPGVRTATIQSVTVNGVSVDPTLATAGPQGSVLAIKDVGSSATVVVSKQITVANKEGVTHSITGDVSTSDRDTTIVFDPVSVRVTADQGSTSVVDEYDTDGDGEISVVELGQAGQDYAAGKLTITELGKIGGNFAS